jgi:hypothetical protein
VGVRGVATATVEGKGDVLGGYEYKKLTLFFSACLTVFDLDDLHAFFFGFKS